MTSIFTARLELVQATAKMLRAELVSREELERAIGATVAPGWPPEFYDEQAIRYTLDRLVEHGESSPWWMYYIVRREDGSPARLIGTCGFKGPPQDGAVEIGYGIVAESQRRGYGSEAARGLAEFAFSHPEVERVVAHTLPELVNSIGLLERCGFELIGPGLEEGTIRYDLDRPETVPHDPILALAPDS